MNRQDFLNYADEIYQGTRAVLKAVPAGRLDFRPEPTMMSVGQLIRHIGSAAGEALKMVAEGNFSPPTEPLVLPTLDQLESFGSVAEALAALEADREALRSTVLGWTEEEFRDKDVQAPWLPGPIKAWHMALSMADHLAGHKMQLFLYLRILGAKVNTFTLYGMEG